MPRIRALLVIAAVAALAIPSAAAAAVVKVSGGTTQVTASSAVTSALSANHITVKPLAPATAPGSTFTFPIVGGRLNTTNLHGVIYHSGGLAISNGTRTVRLRRLTIDSSKSGVFLDSSIAGRTVRTCRSYARHPRRKICVTRTRYTVRRIATVTDVTVTGSTATGNLALSAFTAKAVNALAGKSIASAGTVLGTATIAPKLA